MSGFFAIVRRDLLIARRQGGGSLLAVGFFVIVAALFPFAIGADPMALRRVAPGVIWVAALLATLLSLDRLFQADFEDGSLDILALSPQPLFVTVLAKVLAHWLVVGLPLVIASPLLGVLLNLPPAAFPDLLLAVLIGTPALSLIGAIGAALTAGIRRGGVLVPLLVLPLYIPTLIFGVAASGAESGGEALMLLGAVSLVSLVLAPVAAAAALRLALE
ncbi:heme exporter protein CcmB [Iodidimonas sp. SYSU 1G8]|uniref:heme exporter protein CcmB n=1 Tax=Iodidimonas sp. SYSU 1G8 TaxID=3133967 RepID=UPI0031FE96E4